MKYRLAAFFLGTFALAAHAADPATYTASAAPGANPDAGSASVWTVQAGPQTGAGISQMGSDPHMWQIFCREGGDNVITQTHTFAGGPLAAGQQVSLDYAYNTNIDNGKRVGIRLLDADGKPQVEFAFPGAPNLSSTQTPRPRTRRRANLTMQEPPPLLPDRHRPAQLFRVVR